MSLHLASAFSTISGFFLQGGIFMVFLLILSIIALTVIVHRTMALRENVVMPEVLEVEVERLQPGDELTGLSRLMTQHRSPLSRILLTLLRHLSWQKGENAEAVATQARHETARLESGLVILEITTGVAPILGLLGTLSGLVGIFANVGDGDPIVIARGISEALNTTIVGLAVSAPSLIAYNYFMRKIEVMSVEMESVVAELLVKCYPNPGEQPSIHEDFTPVEDQ